MKIEDLLRPAIRELIPYSSAREMYSDDDMVLLDANENSIGTGMPYNRYPDPAQQELKAKIAALKGVSPEYIALGNGSDETIDLLMRAFCEPGRDNVILFPPTFGMYAIGATVNGIEQRAILQTENFQIKVDEALAAADANTKLILVCTPNNPTGNRIPQADILALLDGFTGLVVVDEAYIDFCPEASFLPYLQQYPNLVVLQTFSKGWGLAGLRLGMAFADPCVVAAINKIRMPYNINSVSASLVSQALDNPYPVEESISLLLNERDKLRPQLEALPFVEHVYPTDANFFLVRCLDAKAVYEHLLAAKILVSNRSSLPLCANTLRISVGTPVENQYLIETLSAFNHG